MIRLPEILLSDAPGASEEEIIEALKKLRCMILSCRCPMAIIRRSVNWGARFPRRASKNRIARAFLHDAPFLLLDRADKQS